MKRLLLIVPMVAAVAVAGMAPAQAEEPPLVQTAEGTQGRHGDCRTDAPPLGELLTVGHDDGQYPDHEDARFFRFAVEPGEAKQFTIAVQPADHLALVRRTRVVVRTVDAGGQCSPEVWAEWFGLPTWGQQTTTPVNETPEFGPGNYVMVVSSGAPGLNVLTQLPGGVVYSILAN